ncbi:MAG TPA: sigma 54-interacting transcriptional regulator [Vicinamibacterales bacterium]|jgi:transcriptional regulator with PAS, ATPase and Fis domain
MSDPRSAVRVVGTSTAWRHAVDRATRVAPTDVTTCLQGESGTGKEVIARFIHELSPRRHGPFIAINCAALPDELLESELFGFERGAFTSAQQSKPGQIELASGGVLFLDEITELTPSAQAKLLRVLQEREFQRLGGTRVVSADVRVIAATNRDLDEAVAQGTFREDLYYRVNVFDIRIPPLRDRGDDVMLLAESFLEDIALARGGRRFTLTPLAAGALRSYPWPGNARQLRNVLERATVICSGAIIEAEDLALAPPVSLRPNTTDLNSVERSTIDRVMRDMEGNVSRAARTLGISRTQLYGRLRKHGFDHATT